MEHRLEKLTAGISGRRMMLGADLVHIGTAVTDERIIRRRKDYCVDAFVVSWILTGEGSFEEGGERYALKDGCVCIRRPDRDYTMELLTGKSARLFINLPEEIYYAICKLVPELSEVPSVRAMPFHAMLWDDFMRLYHDFNRVDTERFYTMLPDIIHYICDITGIHSDRVRQPLLRARRLLEDVSSTLTMEEIAERSGMNYHTMRRTFAEQYGISPGKFRTNKRMEAARRLLMLGESVTETAEQLGYPDIYTFTHRFKTEHGIAPQHFLRSVRDGEAGRE